MYIQLIELPLDMKKDEIIESCNPSTCFSGKIMRSQRIISGIYRKHLTPFGVSNSQISLLLIITKMNGVSQKKLGELLHMEKSTVQRNLQRLFKRNLILEKDKLIYTNSIGFELMAEILPIWQLATEETRLRLSTDGVNGLDQVLNNLIKK